MKWFYRILGACELILGFIALYLSLLTCLLGSPFWGSGGLIFAIAFIAKGLFFIFTLGSETKIRRNKMCKVSPCRMPRRFVTEPDVPRETKIAEMCVGESGWAVPWTLCIDPRHRCFLNNRLTVWPKRGGAATMHVTKGINGFVVDISGCRDERWKPDSDHCESDQYVPVRLLIC